MDAQDIDWNQSLKSTPWGKNMFTEAMWDNVERRIRNSKPSRTRRLRLTIASTTLVIAAVIFGLWHFAATNISVPATVQVVPDKFVRIEAKHYSTIMPATWVQLNIFPDPDEIGYKPSLNSKTDITISNALNYFTTKDQSKKNMLLENYNTSKSPEEFEKKMLISYKDFGSIAKIDNFNGTNIYGQQTNSGYNVYAYPVASKTPFLVVLQSQEIAEISQLKSTGYYDIVKQLVTHTFPRE